MDTLPILCTLCNVKTFLGVFPSDLLPHSIKQPGTIIVNCDPHRKRFPTGWQLIFNQNHSADSILTNTVIIHIFLLSIPFETHLFCVELQYNPTTRSE